VKLWGIHLIQLSLWQKLNYLRFCAKCCFCQMKPTYKWRLKKRKTMHYLFIYQKGQNALYFYLMWDCVFGIGVCSTLKFWQRLDEWKLSSCLVSSFVSFYSSVMQFSVLWPTCLFLLTFEQTIWRWVWTYAQIYAHI